MSTTMVIAMYRPHTGKNDQVLALIKEHHPVLKGQEFVTDRKPLVLRSGDGTYLEIFEWISPEVINKAHLNPVVKEIWERFEAVCDYAELKSLPEAGGPFPHFELVDV